MWRETGRGRRATGGTTERAITSRDDAKTAKEEAFKIETVHVAKRDQKQNKACEWFKKLLQQVVSAADGLKKLGAVNDELESNRTKA